MSSDVKELKSFIGQLSGDNLFSAGLVGSVSMLQTSTDQLKKTFALWYADRQDDTKKEAVRKALLEAHAVSVITDDQLEWCLVELDKE